MADMLRLGVDFGTSNSAAGFLQDGKVRLIEVEPGRTTLPTAFFFDYDSRETLIGSAANDALLHGLDGRYMRALKRVLGTSLMHEKRQILNEPITFVEIIARFLRVLKTQAEATTGMQFETALSGRPVRFHSQDPAREARAEDDLRQCYLAAGFKDVEFLPEPQAAAIAANPQPGGASLGLVVDIGGGTSDFSLFETDASGKIEIITNQGVTIGGTDFDRVLPVDHVMPLLGKGTLLRKEFGPGSLTMPNAIFTDLATWEEIPFLYSASTRQSIAEMHKLAFEPDKLAHLQKVLELELGHDLAFAVERGKIAINDDLSGNISVDLGFIKNGMKAGLDQAAMHQSLRHNVELIKSCAIETLKEAEIAPGRVEHVIFVGGSSLMSAVSAAIEEAFPNARRIYSEVFTAVAAGLALAA